MKQVYPREHGGDIFYAARVTGIPVGEIMDFSASINPLGPPPGAIVAARMALRMVHHYPEPGAERLADEVARTLGESLDAGRGLARRIVPGNGSTELIYLLPRALKPGSVLIHEPAFSEYARAALISGAKVKTAGNKKLKFSFDFARFAEGMRGAQMAFLCNPNNPTGEVLSRDTVFELAREAKKTRCLLVVDEAFIDFCPGSSVIDEAAMGKNRYLAVLRSMTKFYALTGLRAGYAVLGAESMAGRVLGFKEPWSINFPAAEAAIAALRDRGHAGKSLLFMAEERAFVARRLEKAGIWRSGGIKAGRVAEGAGGPNFFLVRLPEARKFVKKLFMKGLLVRDCSNFRNLRPITREFGEEGFIRFAVRTRRENGMLLTEMEEWMRRVAF